MENISEANKWRLLKDIVSGRQQIYGKRHEIVTEVADHGNVLIVERKDGSRFPVLTDDIAKAIVQ